MEWPSTLTNGDAVIVREETRAGLRFVVHSRRGPQFTCRTYAEAEARTLAYAERARGHAWYSDGCRLQLISHGHRAIPSQIKRQVGVQEIK
ncbi:MAG: hypothetical protein A3G76_08050 [Acidobacteria bacterium RIFCSPLOWO2_12_FULL_65_11]|nr:MAG: hypothetical protein A3H95_05315 [Acidobacteria bacterium RIFCSPLOWO2_02_FULL_64_15]OFW28359.1 MAG: hypothetical protein A3G76_08050 [Acidobacteria bacterium RIFCSPLOWO2_12_FULL_65_11]